MANWYQNDTAVDDYYREQYERAYGYDPLDPDWTEDDIPDFEEDTYDADESDAVRRARGEMSRRLYLLLRM